MPLAFGAGRAHSGGVKRLVVGMVVAVLTFGIGAVPAEAGPTPGEPITVITPERPRGQGVYLRRQMRRGHITLVSLSDRGSHHVT
jgi:hypothetical protein